MDWMEDFLTESKDHFLRIANYFHTGIEEDIITDCHIKVCEKYGKIDQVSYIKLMRQSVGNQSVDEMRKQAKGAIDLLIEEMPVDEQIFKNLEIKLMWKCIWRLTPEERILVLDNKKGQSGAYRSKVKRAKMKLKKMIQEMN